MNQTCPKCGISNTSTAFYCANCQADLRTKLATTSSYTTPPTSHQPTSSNTSSSAKKKICPKCSASNSSTVFYCSSCQSDLSGVSASQATLSNPTFKSPSYTYNSDNVSIGTWLGILIATGIPVVGFIVLIGITLSSDNKSLQNYAKANLILMAIGLLFGLLIVLG